MIRRSADRDEATGLNIGASQRRRREGARNCSDAEQRLALFAISLVIQQRRGTCLVIEQDGFDNIPDVAARASREAMHIALAVKCLHDPMEVATAWRAGHQALNELPANERPAVRMMEECVMRGREFLSRKCLVSGIIVLRGSMDGIWIEGLAAHRCETRQDHIIEQTFRTGEVPVSYTHLRAHE